MVARFAHRLASNGPSRPLPRLRGRGKLIFVGDPGALVSPAFNRAFRGNSAQFQGRPPGRGLALSAGDHPETIGLAVAAWIGAIEGARRDGDLIAGKIS